MIQFKSIAGVAATLAVLGALGGVAHANDMRFAYADLDLSQPEQARALDQRINLAAAAFCEDEQYTGTRIRQTDACIAAARDAALSALPKAKRQAFAAAMATPSTAQLTAR